MTLKAVVMAGGEGTRLRPLTSNQPKPMVRICGKPCMEHIVELLAKHGFDEVIVTLAFQPQAIRGYFGSGESLGIGIGYSVEESPLGTAGSVRLAAPELDETFLVISGDALCDIDLTALVAFHKARGAAVTVGLKAVENPLDFGIVVTDGEGRIERFLEKPSWGEVFSDTINTGIYVLEPEVLEQIPADRPFDFAKELFPLLLEQGLPMYGYVCDGYWQDIGNLDQYLQANFDALDGKVKLNIPGIRLRGNIWIGEGAEVDDLDAIEGPAFVGRHARISPGAVVGPYSVLGASVTLRERAYTTHSVVDASTYLGHSVRVEGAILGRHCDVRSHVRIYEGVAIGDEVKLGSESEIMPGVRIYPYKEVDSGTVIHESLIWESRVSARIFSHDVVTGLINVDLTPETAVQLAAALGTTLKASARVVASRESPAACRMIKRAMIAGLVSTGVSIADLRTLPAAIGRELLKTQGYDAGFHVGLSPSDPELVRIQFFEPPGVELSSALQKEIEKHFTRRERRRAAIDGVGSIDYPSRVRESYAQGLLSALDREGIRRRRFRIVLDYGYSSAAYVMPLVLGPLDVEAVTAHAAHGEEQTRTPLGSAETINQARRLVQAVGADLGAVFDRAAERLYLVDETGSEVALDQALLLMLQLLASRGRTGRLALPVTVTSQADRMLEGSGLEIVRTRTSLSELTRAAAGEGVVFAGAVGGGFVWPDFLPAYDAMASLCKLLELLAPVEQPLSELVAALPEPTLLHRMLQCPWSLKGTVMRVLNEALADRDVDVTDGIKLFDELGWVQVLPDADEPLIHIYAEGTTREDSEALGRTVHDLIDEVVTGAEAETSTRG